MTKHTCKDCFYAKQETKMILNEYGDGFYPEVFDICALGYTVRADCWHRLSKKDYNGEKTIENYL